MSKLQTYDNAKLIYDLYCYMDTKTNYTYLLGDSFGKSINCVETLFFGYNAQINSLSERYKNKLFPIVFLTRDREIVLFEGKYVRIDTDVCFEELDPNCIYTTPEEVWEKAIKVEIEECYNVKINEETGEIISLNNNQSENSSNPNNNENGTYDLPSFK